MIGLIAGDCIGSRWEGYLHVPPGWDLLQEPGKFTDDTVTAIAVADALLEGCPVAEALRSWWRRYPDRRYGGFFWRWARGNSESGYDSTGAGAVTRAVAVGWLANSAEEAEARAWQQARVTHGEEASSAAQAVAGLIWRLRTGWTSQDAKAWLAEVGWPVQENALGRQEIIGSDAFYLTPRALGLGLEAKSWTQAIRGAIDRGGDCDTAAALAGAVAEARGLAVPEEVEERVRSRLPDDILDVLDRVIGHRKASEARD